MVAFARYMPRKATHFLTLCLRRLKNPVKPAVEQKPWNMNSIAGWVGAMAIGIAAIFYPQKSKAEKFTGEEFLTWSVDGQDNYIGIAATMAAMVAGRVNPATGTCLDQWYAASEALTAERNMEIRATIARNSEYHPSAVILLMLEGACGAFNRK
mmetsp:Transcript_29089/g.55958  ORF Transcript_29089/g.55958 Transcript_29089/m.55958 type:complete len:154 (+) Transcript_29089:286-747(+)